MLYKKFKVVVGVSEPIREVLVDAGVPAEKVQVVQNGVRVGDEIQVEQDVLNRLREELKLQDGECCLINTGRLTKQKAQKDIVTAAGILRGKGIPGRFLIVGEGELKEDLKRQIDAENLSDRVELLGFRDDITEMLQIADIFLLPSLDEGMPMSLLEAAAVGLPVVVTEVGDIPKLVEDQVSGLVVPVGRPETLAEAVVQLVAHPEKGAQMGVAAQDKVRQMYSNQVMFSRYDRVYGDLMGIPGA